MLNITDYVKHRITAGHLTQSAVARGLGLSPAELSKKLNGHRNWLLRDLPLLADFFGMPIDKLVRAIDEFEGEASAETVEV